MLARDPGPIWLTPLLRYAMLSNGTDHEGLLDGVSGTAICVNAPVKLYDDIGGV